MATIPLRPSLFSLIVTFVSVTAELGLLSALILFNSLVQCTHLSHGKAISISRHKSRIKLIAIASMLLFVIVEILASSNTFTVFDSISKEQPCTITAPLLPGPHDERGAEIVFLSCLRVNNSEVLVFPGNHSTPDGTVACADSYAYRYLNQERVDQTFEGEGVMSCTEDDSNCVIARAKRRVLFLSAPFERPPPNVDPSQLIQFYPTHLTFDPKPHLELFSQKAADSYLHGVTDDLTVRKRTIMGSMRDTCSFTSQGSEHTEIPTALLTVSICVWITSVVLFFISLPLRKRIYFDMNNPLHWANRARRTVDEEVAANFVQCTQKGDGRRIFLTENDGS